MKALNRSNIFFFITVILLSVMIFCTKHNVLTFLSDAKSTEHLVAVPPFPLMPIEMAMSIDPFMDFVILFTSFFFIVTFFFSEDKKLRIFLWGLVLMGFVLMSVAMLLLKYLTGI